MPASHLFAYSNEAICVAEDSAVAFYGARTLRKFRVERFSGARICGLCIEARTSAHAALPTTTTTTSARGGRHRVGHGAASSGADADEGSLLHVVDVEGNWFVVALRTITVVLSATLRLRAATATTTTTRPVIAARRLPPSLRGARAATSSATATATAADDVLVMEQAHFHAAGGVLHAVLLTRNGVFEVALPRHGSHTQRHSSGGGDDAEDGGGALVARVAVPFTRPLRDCLVAVGWNSGLIVVAQHGQRWLLHSSYNQRKAAAAAAGSSGSSNSGALVAALQQQQCMRELPIAVQSLACSPVSAATANATDAAHDMENGSVYVDDVNDSAGDDKDAASSSLLLRQPSPSSPSAAVTAAAEAEAAVAVAVGGVRGELLVFHRLSSSSSSRGVDHYFADHWHHTPLTALAFAPDGRAVYTAAAESVLLVWSLTSYTHTKVTCNTGPVHSIIVPAATTTAAAMMATTLPRLLLACRTATLAVVDVVQMRLQAVVEGIEWSAAQACSDLVVDTWRGQPAVLLMGLPNVLRVCDPLTQQSLYSLHVSSQMETVPCAPRYGIRFAGLLRDGQVLVTYELFVGTVLPALLRFWAYDAAVQRHVEVQTVYAPHTREVTALQVDKAHDRIFTLCCDAVKCWQEVREEHTDAYASRSLGDLVSAAAAAAAAAHDANDGDAAAVAAAVAARASTSRVLSWRNQSTMTTPTRAVRCMSLSADGSVCAVADDSVYLYAVRDCRPGEPWPLLCTLLQHVHTYPLRHVVLLPSSHTVVAHSSSHDDNDEDNSNSNSGSSSTTRVHGDADDVSERKRSARERAVFVWDLTTLSSSTSLRAHVYYADAPVTAMCAYAHDSVLLATAGHAAAAALSSSSSLALCELCCAPGPLFARVRATVTLAEHVRDGRPHTAATATTITTTTAVAARRRLLHMQRIPHVATQLAVVDNLSGFRVLHITLQRSQSSSDARGGVAVDVALSPRADADATTATTTATLRNYFDADGGRDAHDVLSASRDGSNVGHDEDGAAAAAETATTAAVATRAAHAQRWLGSVLLRESAYMAPPMSTLLTQYLRRRTSA